MRRVAWPVVVVAIFVGGTAIVLSLAYWEYRRLVDYCKGLAPAASLREDPLACLDAANSFAVNVELLFLVVLEAGVVIGAAIVGLWWRKRRRRTQEAR